MTSEADRHMAAQFDITVEEMDSISQTLNTILEGKPVGEGAATVRQYVLDNPQTPNMAFALAFYTGALVTQTLYKPVR